MKQLYTFSKRVAATVALLLALHTSHAQVLPDAYFNIDWQVGMPVSDSFVDKTSGWGMNFEGGYFLTDAITIGAFLNYQTNFRSVPRQTLDLGGGSALTTSQKHALFQMPFGVAGRYNWLPDSKKKMLKK